MINHHAGKGWLDYFWGIVGEIPLSGSEDYRNIYSQVKFPGRSIPFYHHHNKLIFIHSGGTKSLCGVSEEGEVAQRRSRSCCFFFFLIGGY